MTLVEFLRTRLDDDQKTAEAAAARYGPRWEASGGNLYDESNPSTHPGPFATGVWGDLDDEVADHIACHDPAQVLAEVDAKRRVAELHHAVTDGTGETSCGACWKPRQLYPAAWPCETLRLLALSHAGHPDYDESWRP